MDNYEAIVLALLLSTTLSLSPPSVTKRYRADYEYNDRTRAFYKLHIESRLGWLAQSSCEMEGASLMKADTQDDIAQLHGMFKKFPDLGNYVFVAPDGAHHESAEEPALITLTPDTEEDSYNSHSCNVVSRKGEIESVACYHAGPFICKVELKDAPYDPKCDLFSTNYRYIASVGSCYNIPRRVGSWSEAYAECRHEGSHLVIINSETERAVVQSLLQITPKVPGTQASWFFYAGFRANKPVGNETLVFKTIFNQTLQEAGFAEWSPNEPNNALGNEYCGTIFKNDGKFNDVDCSRLFAFVCEKEIRT